MNFPIGSQIGEVYGSKRSSKECYVKAISMESRMCLSRKPTEGESRRERAMQMGDEELRKKKAMRIEAIPESSRVGKDTGKASW